MNQKDCCHVEKNSSLTPLYILLGGILGVSLALTYFFPSNTFMMYLMGVWFLAFGLLKLYDIGDFARSFSRYDIIAKRWNAYGYVFPFIETIIGLIYILNTSMLYMTLINIIALVISLLGIISAYKIISSGQSIACACMGTYWKLPMTKVTLIENLFMFLMVGYMLIYPASMIMTSASSNDDALMREHCKVMPNMAGCEKYKNTTLNQS